MYLVSSLAGGTGSGIVFDTAFKAFKFLFTKSAGAHLLYYPQTGISDETIGLWEFEKP